MAGIVSSAHSGTKHMGDGLLQTVLNTATIDELEALLDISRATAKEIVKARISKGKLDKDILRGIRGIGPKTLEKAEVAFSL